MENPTKTTNRAKTKSVSAKDQKMSYLIGKYVDDADDEPISYNHNDKENSKKNLAAERCLLLYEKGKIKSEVNRLMYQKNEELRLQQELNSCTFKPKLNTTVKKKDSSKFNNSDMYNKNIHWKKMQDQK